MITREQAETLREFFTVSHTGKVFRWRRNGRTQTWKTRPTEWELPLKHGQYAYWRPSEFDAGELYATQAEAERVAAEIGARKVAN